MDVTSGATRPRDIDHRISYFSEYLARTPALFEAQVKFLLKILEKFRLGCWCDFELSEF